MIDLKIHEGKQTRVSRVDLEGLTAIPEAVVIKEIRIQAGKPFGRSKLKNDEKRIAMMVSEKGYPYVQVSGDATFNEDQTQCRGGITGCDRTDMSREARPFMLEIFAPRRKCSIGS